MSYQEQFYTYNLSKPAQQDFENYLVAVKRYDENPTIDNSVSMKDEYMNIFSDIKIALSLHQISRSDFEKLREIIDNV